ncbi:phosphatidylinositide phosphatase SAC2-like isoform X1 [Varroa destructor]|uniref:Phosphatidylinositide phosphatase SAC2 n=1 Tax=Varroa destructor TaxID=109461 RepID=A0A7M7KVK1_VARDE|nr:phosphatidylinositide phosphatase SAC2-like isoform X1 [Varroa destructor]
MEVLCSPTAYILISGEHSLWCSRIDGSLMARRVCSLAELTDPQCLGVIYGIVGKFQPTSESTPYLVVIRNASIVGVLPDQTDVFKVNRVALLPLTTEGPAVSFGDLDLCRKHHVGAYATEPSPERSLAGTYGATTGGRSGASGGIQKTWSSLKSATSTLQHTAAGGTTGSARRPYGGASGSATANSIKEKYEQRLLDELVKMFDGTESFYFSPKGDLTNTMQRKESIRRTEAERLASGNKEEREKRPWANYDDRFFWNRAMISELLNHLKLEEVLPWITPLIQGFVQIDRLAIQDDNSAEVYLTQDNGTWVECNPPAQTRLFNMFLISRRSRHRAGTRYKRRGVDEKGKCANFVETEQMFEFGRHVVSFVLVRGSVPLFWSQPGVKYRPPPQLDRGEEETQIAFRKHFEQQLELYGKQVIVSLVEQSGKEGVIARAYLEHILRFDSPKLAYVAFDFHDYCRGMHFENVAILTNKLKEDPGLKDAWSYLWLDGGANAVCEQAAVFRVNCIDCLDRTNVVQTAIARDVMETQFLRLGLLSPEASLPLAVRRAFQAAWANNGDTISRQYAGTVALKGDYTRTGARKLSGLMKDGYNSANRYYLNRFRDAYRQSVIDLMLGNPVDQEDMAVSPEQQPSVGSAGQIGSVKHAVVEVESLLEGCQHEHVKQLIEDCKKMLVPEDEVCLGGWALIDADPTTGDAQATDMDSILLLTNEAYFVAEYDDLTDRITRFQRVLLEDLEKMEMGPEPSLFKSRRHCLRLHYLVSGQGGYFHMFRCASTRLFNNVAVPIASEEEAIESLRAICESLKVALSVKSLNVPLFEGKLERRRSKMAALLFQHAAAGTGTSTAAGGVVGAGRIPPQLDVPPLPPAGSLPRNISEGQLMNFVGQVGSRALNSVSSQLSRLNPMKRSGQGSGGSSGSVASSLGGGSSSYGDGYEGDINGGRNCRDSVGGSSRQWGGCAFGGSSQAILMTVAEQAGEDRVSPEPPAQPQTPQGSAKTLGAAPNSEEIVSLERCGFMLACNAGGDLDRAVSSAEMFSRRERERPKPPNYISIDRTLSSDYSECSDLLGAPFEELNQMTDDGLLESCGILASSFKDEIHDSESQVLRRKLSQASSGGSSGGNVAGCASSSRSTLFHTGVLSQSALIHQSTATDASNVIDDFVLDAMRKTSLQQLKKRHRMSLNASKEALCAAPTIHVDPAISGSCAGETKTGYTSQSLSEKAMGGVRSGGISKSTDTLDESGTRDLKGDDVSGRCVFFGARGPALHLTQHQQQQQQQQHSTNLSVSQLSVIQQQSQAVDSEGRMKTSHSESALTSPGALTGGGASPLKSPSTPIHIIKKDLVLSPLSKIAKGVQSFGQSVLLAKSPSRSSAAAGSGIEMTMEEAAALAQRKANCKTLIIEV